MLDLYHELTGASWIPELAVAQAIVAAAERHADGPARVSVVRVRIGWLRQVVPEYLDFYFDVAARDTLCEGASLEWERVPRSSLFGLRRRVDPAPPPATSGDELIVRFRCLECESADHRVLSGDELIVESIDVTDRDESGATGCRRAMARRPRTCRL